ncbi:MAG: AAA family ATPase [Planctomycetota bacterium]|jgi:chromosome partitioning protein
MKTIAVVNQKGGCGKTTVSINLSSAMAEAGQKVLLVDMDPQSHCAVGLAVPEEQIEQSIYDVLISRSRNEPMKMTEILWQISDRLELAPASIDLSAFEQQMTGISERELCLKEALQEMRNDYDYAIVDCPPAVGLLTFNALRAASDVIVPVETGYFALHGLSKQLETLSILCKRCSQQVDVKVLASMYDIRTKMAREILAELRSHFGDQMFETIVSFNTKIKEAASFGQPISEYDPASKGRKDFSALADEILGTQAKQQRHEFVNSLADQLGSISATADELLEAAKPSIIAIDSQDELAPAEAAAFREFETGTEVREFQSDGAEEVPAVAEQDTEIQESTIDAKLADYYGVTQTNDAAVFVSLYPRAQQVQIAGDFNNWQPEKSPMEKVNDNGVWQTKMNLAAGRYRYRLVVDGQWQQDPYNETTEQNPFGGLNSVLEVK